MIQFFYMLVGLVLASYQTYQTYKEGNKDKQTLFFIFLLTLFLWPFLFLYFKAVEVLKKKK